ncbi:hypothetical protein HPB50_027748 [Hyalomma asiaticum]|nr:hypothetical protein HPB50_027748 [Hyalomma asiaticum]
MQVAAASRAAWNVPLLFFFVFNSLLRKLFWEHLRLRPSPTRPARYAAPPLPRLVVPYSCINEYGALTLRDGFPSSPSIPARTAYFSCNVRRIYEQRHFDYEYVTTPPRGRQPLHQNFAGTNLHWHTTDAKTWKKPFRGPTQATAIMADTTEDFPPGFTLSSTMGRSRAYDLLLREAGMILNCPASRVPLSPRRRTRRTKRHTPVRQAKRPRPGNTSSQPAVPFPSATSSQGPFSLPASPLQPAGDVTAAAILSPPPPEQPSPSPPSSTTLQETSVQPRGEESSSSETEQEEQHSSNASSSSWEQSTPPSSATSSPQATTDNSQPSVAPAGPSAPAPPRPSHTTPTGKEILGISFGDPVGHPYRIKVYDECGEC